VSPAGKKPGNMSDMITFFTSAFWVRLFYIFRTLFNSPSLYMWHGIASGYYLTFLLGGFITAAVRQA
jgi:lysophospholipid acyltransferase